MASIDFIGAKFQLEGIKQSGKYPDQFRLILKGGAEVLFFVEEGEFRDRLAKLCVKSFLEECEKKDEK